MSARAAPNRRKQKRERNKSLVWLTEAQAVLTWGVLLALIALLGAIYLYQTSRIARVGREVQVLQLELDEVKRANAGLERAIAEAQSLERLQAEAARLGFTRAQPEDVEYLVVPDFPREPVQTPEPEATQPAQPIESISEALLLTMKASFGDLVTGEAR